MKLDVIKYQAAYLWGSAVVILLGLVAMVISWQQVGLPLKPGIDFTGGTRISLGLTCPTPPTCGAAIELDKVRSVLAAQKYENVVLQLLGDDRRGLSVQTGNLEVAERAALQNTLQTALAEWGEIDRARTQIDQVGPLVSQELLSGGLLALGVALVGIMLYLTQRFQLDYAAFATLALLHDILVVMGVFAWLGLLLGVEVDSLFMVALLTIAGYSVNDTVIIYDRIRENLKLQGDNYSFNELVNFSVNQTFTRSINTSLTTILPLLSVLLFGGVTLKYFALALIVGFLAGAYSSIFNASILLAWWRGRQQNA